MKPSGEISPVVGQTMELSRGFRVVLAKEVTGVPVGPLFLL
jgi:hypothetical protein